MENIIKKERPGIQRRKDEHAARTITRIWDEQALEGNPYLAEHCRCRGYDLLELMEKRSLVDVLYLLLRGELPSRDQARLLETLMVAFINPGPRHPATRAAMNAGVGKTYPVHILPISLSVAGGDYLGGGEVAEAMLFLKKHLKADPAKIATDLLDNTTPPEKGDWHIAPGFGCRFGGTDPLPQEIAVKLAALPGNGRALQWGSAFADALKPHGMGWVSTGVCAAAFLDLGFVSRTGPGLFQLICAPGLLAHGLELATKTINAMPFIDEEHYVIEPEAKTQKT
ncbi:MAG: citrate synthase [Desulfobacteraceae bacterium]|nr:citrate synthase [Desulfobacteraceae bacterium]